MKDSTPKETTVRTNPLCPSWHSHYENAADRLHPGIDVLTGDQDVAVVEAAKAEWSACEGHQ